MKFIKSTTRMYSLDTIKEWYLGESEYLKRMLGIGFENTLYISKKGFVEFYYDSNEINKFEKALEEYLGEEEFNDICDEFMRKIENPNVKIREIVPHLTIFNEVDESPEWFEEEYRDNCLRRLMRIRKTTESKLYELQKSSKLKDFIYYKGRLYK